MFNTVRLCSSWVSVGCFLGGSTYQNANLGYSSQEAATVEHLKCGRYNGFIIILTTGVESGSPSSSDRDEDFFFHDECNYARLLEPWSGNEKNSSKKGVSLDFQGAGIPLVAYHYYSDPLHNLCL